MKKILFLLDCLGGQSYKLYSLYSFAGFSVQSYSLLEWDTQVANS